MEKEYRSGFVALIGKPNVGKSTLLNYIVKEKVAITSPKPQTTRRRVLGVYHGENSQIVFVDTPGIYKAEHRLGQWMLDSAKTEGREADMVVWVADGSAMPSKDDERVAAFLAEINVPKILVVNKVDLVKPKDKLLPRLAAFRDLGDFEEVFPVSAVSGDNVQALVEYLVSRLPEGCPYFPEDQLSDQSEKMQAEEIIREKVLLNTQQEVPHAVAVMAEEYRLSEKGDMQIIKASIFVEREGQKKIILGRQGAKLKKIGTEARAEIEKLLGRKVFLDLWVKVKEDWRSRADWLRALGYSD
ncbi:MAG: GTPase Era [bacterium]|nr:GTPase Era [bacterium]